ncbi:MAG: outer membrane protein assembly factor BamA, partial [Bdellovibrionales bacterium]|nr:outer membrane protein assembly factor BamA [Bdellovibrionales bacterium]
VRKDIQSIFAMGFFEDISVSAKDVDSTRVDLIVTVRERPVIAEIRFEGNEKISTDDLKEVLKLKEWSILDINRVKDDVASLQKHYEEKGYYLARVSYRVESIKNEKTDEVRLVFQIQDFDKVEIKKITFLNNKHFTDRQLKKVFQETQQGGTFSLGGGGNFKDAAFKQDLQRLTYWYLEHGYVKFRYEAPVITVSDDKRWVFISIYLDEGEQYSMGSQDFSGDLLFPKDELQGEISLLSGETFSISKRNQDIQRLTEKYQDLGYAFTNVVPKMAIRDETRTVDLDYSFEKGELVYFGQITVVGNSKTHDKVVRRELKIEEGQLYSGSRLRQSRENVERLGFFAPGEVLFNTSSPRDKPNVLDLEVQVKERSTGTITLGAGYGTVQKFFFTTQVSEINLAGRGQSVSLSGNYSADRVSRSVNLGFTDPYAFDTRWSAGFDVFAVNFPIPNRYLTRKLGFDVRLGHPIGEFTNLYVTYKNEGLKITEIKDPSIDVSLDSGVLSSTVFSVIRDVRNNRFETTAGNYQSASVETAGVLLLGGDKTFIKLGLNNRYYKRLFGDLVFRNSVEYGHLLQAGGQGVPPAERFFLGGPNNLKGYEFFSVGPTKPSTTGGQIPQGGLVQMLALFELEYPIIREAGLKSVFFYDAGNAFNEFPGTNGTPLTIRTDAGFGIRWFSPIGPLRFEWGFPFKARPGESTTVFQFFIGPPF